MTDLPIISNIYGVQIDKAQYIMTAMELFNFWSFECPGPEDRQEEVDEVITPHRMFLAEPPTLYNCHNRNIELT